jgi:hypothetical protein
MQTTERESGLCKQTDQQDSSTAEPSLHQQHSTIMSGNQYKATNMAD